MSNCESRLLVLMGVIQFNPDQCYTASECKLSSQGLPQAYGPVNKYFQNTILGVHFVVYGHERCFESS